MVSQPPPTNLVSKLPNELLRKIITNFAIDTETAPQYMYDDDDPYFYPPIYANCARSHANELRESTLKSLCLTCKKLSGFAVEELYSSIVLKNPGSRTFERLSLLLRTLMQDPRLAALVKFVEMPAFKDFQDNLGLYTLGCYLFTFKGDWYELTALMTTHAMRIWGPTPSRLLADWQNDLRLFPEKALLELLVAMCPNIAHLKLGIPWVGLMSSLDRFGLSAAQLDTKPPSINRCHLRKLRRFTMLYLMSNMPQRSDTHPADLTRTLKRFPITPEICAIGRAYDDIRVSGIPPDYSPLDRFFTDLSSVSYLDTDLTSRDIVTMIRACNTLTRFEAVWEKGCSPRTRELVGIVDQLRHCKNTLQHLIIGGDGWIHWDSNTFRTQVDFSMFSVLRTLELPHHMLLCPDTFQSHHDEPHSWSELPAVPSVAKFLPASIFTLRTYHTGLSRIFELRDRDIWYEFARDAHLLRQLKHVTFDRRSQGWEYKMLEATLWIDWPNIIAQFAESGVNLEVM